MGTRSSDLALTSAIVLAGGLGTRLRDAVPDLPKPMAPINGRPFLELLLDYWIGQGIREFILSVGYKHDHITGHFGEHYGEASIKYAIERTPLGTGGGLLLAAAQRTSDTPVLILNGDTFFAVSLERISEFHQSKNSDWTFALFQTDEAARYMGMQVAGDGRIESLRSGAAGQAGLLANGGVYIASPRALHGCGYKAGDKASLEDDIMSGLLGQGAGLYGMLCHDCFIDIGIPQDYHRASHLLGNSTR